MTTPSSLPKRPRQGLAIWTQLRLGVLSACLALASSAAEPPNKRAYDVPASDVRANASLSDVTADGVLKLSLGKKQHILVKPV